MVGHDNGTKEAILLVELLLSKGITTIEYDYGVDGVRFLYLPHYLPAANGVMVDIGKTCGVPIFKRYSDNDEQEVRYETSYKQSVVTAELIADILNDPKSCFRTKNWELYGVNTLKTHYSEVWYYIKEIVNKK